MTLNEAIEYAEKQINEPDIAKFLRHYKKLMEDTVRELEHEKASYECNLDHIRLRSARSGFVA